MLRQAMLGALGASLLLSSPSLAATRYVDDDGAQCARAAFTSIQAAVDASGPGDVVRVCAGTYAEQVVADADRPRLVLRSLPVGAARIDAPPSGIANLSPAEFTEPRFALVALDGERQRIEGFDFGGALPVDEPAPDDVYPCNNVAAVELGGERTIALRNTIRDLTGGSCPDGRSTRSTVGIRLAAPLGGLVDLNRIHGGDLAITYANNQGGVVQRNKIRNAQVGVAVGEVAYDDFAFDVLVRSNEISDGVSGIDLSGSGRIAANDVHDNGASGIHIDDNAFVVIERNFLRRNGNGIAAFGIGSHSLGRGGRIQDNRIRDNVGDGIHLEGCLPRCFPASSDFLVQRNTSLGNGSYDCLDAGGDNVWRRNVGIKDEPADICHPPS